MVEERVAVEPPYPVDMVREVLAVLAGGNVLLHETADVLCPGVSGERAIDAAGPRQAPQQRLELWGPRDCAAEEVGEVRARQLGAEARVGEPGDDGALYVLEVFVKRKESAGGGTADVGVDRVLEDGAVRGVGWGWGTWAGLVSRPICIVTGDGPLAKHASEALDSVVDGLRPPLFDAAAGVRTAAEGEPVGDAGRVDDRQDLDVPCGVTRGAHEVGEVVPHQVEVVTPAELEQGRAGASRQLLGEPALGQVPGAHQGEEEPGPPGAEAVAVA